MIFVYFFIFVFGAIVGSFLNCLIYRLENKKRKNLLGRSFCPECSHPLGFWDLIPLLSFLFLRGKCRYCKGKISWQYPLVETATGLLFILIFNFQFSIFNQFSIAQFSNIIYLWLISSFLIVIFVFDLKHYLIPSKLVYLGILAVFLFGIWDLGFVWNLEFGIWNFKPLFASILSGLGAGTFFFLIWLVSRGKWMGFGDIELALLLGFFLGFPNILLSLFLSFFIGAIIGIGLIVLKKKELKSKVPFGPFLITGAFTALFWGKEIINWYLNFLH